MIFTIYNDIFNVFNVIFIFYTLSIIYKLLQFENKNIPCNCKIVLLVNIA